MRGLESSHRTLNLTTSDRPVRRPGLVPAAQDATTTVCSLMFSDPDTAALAIAFIANHPPDWALSEMPLEVSYKDPSMPEEPPAKLSQKTETGFAETPQTAVKQKQRQRQGKDTSRRRSTTDAGDKKSSKTFSGADARRASESAQAPSQHLARQTQLLNSLSDVMKSLSVEDRSERGAKTKAGPSRVLSASTLVEVADDRGHGKPAPVIWSPTGAMKSSPPPLKPILAAELMADITLSRGVDLSRTRIMRLIEGPTGLGLWNSNVPVPIESTGIKDGDLLKLGSVRLDLLLQFLSSPIVRTVEFVTFSPQPHEILRGLESAGGADCNHGMYPVCLIVVPSALRWFREVKAHHDGKASNPPVRRIRSTDFDRWQLRIPIDLDAELGDGAAWGMLIVENEPDA